MGIVNGLLGIRIVTPESSLERAKRAHPYGRQHRCPAGPSSSNRRTEGESIRRACSLSVAPEIHLTERERWIAVAANILPAVAHTKVLTEAPVIAESPTLSEVLYTRYLRNDRT